MDVSRKMSIKEPSTPLFNSDVNKEPVSPSIRKGKLLYRSLTRRVTQEGFLSITPQGFTTEFTNTVEKPLFISDFPFEQGFTIFDCFFNLDTNQWNKFNLDKSNSSMLQKYQDMLPSLRLI